MALIHRVTRLFRADFHAILDRIEEPDLLLKQSVREMEAEIDHDEQRIKLLKHESEQVQERLGEIKQMAEQLDEELDICFESGNHDLARVIIRRKLEAGQMQKHLARKRTGLESSLSDLQSRIDENRTRLVSMQQKLELLTEKESVTGESAYSSLRYQGEFSVKDEDIEVTFLREQQKRTKS